MLNKLTEKGAVTSDKIDFTTINLGETYPLQSAIPSLPVIAYNGTNVLCATGFQNFSGGTYLLMMSSVSCSVSHIDYQAHFAYSIDGDDWIHVNDWAYWGNQGVAGERSFIVPISLSKGTHNIRIGFGTNSTGKNLGIPQSQDLSVAANIVKVG